MGLKKGKREKEHRGVGGHMGVNSSQHPGLKYTKKSARILEGVKTGVEGNIGKEIKKKKNHPLGGIRRKLLGLKGVAKPNQGKQLPRRKVVLVG